MDRKFILIVDDSEVNRAILIQQFKDDFEILEAENGEEALNLINEYKLKISVIILDIIMPIKDGFFVLEEMKKMNLLELIPVIISSGAEESNYEMRALEMGAMDYIHKSANIKIVKLRIKSVLARVENEKLRIQNEIFMREKENEERYRTVIEKTNTIVLELNKEFSILKHDELIKDIMGDELYNKNFIDVLRNKKAIKENDIKTIETFFSSVKKSTIQSDKIEIKLKSINSGIFKWYRLNLVKIYQNNDEIKKYIMTINDANEEIVYRKELLFDAEYDKLTKIFKFNSFCENTKELLQKKPDVKYVVARFDVQKFKLINDIFGYQTGDKLLKYIARRIAIFTRGIGTYGRLTSDVFAICFPYSEENIEKMIKQSIKDLNRFPIEFNIVTCFGLYIADDISVPVDIMLDRAEIALRTVKGHYTNCYAYYTKELRNTLLEEQEIISQMHIAIEEEQFIIYLQPKCRLNTGEIISSEALVRWIHPEKGMIMPDKFISVFERNGFIMKLDAFVWEKTCQLIRKWIDNDMPVLPISVNISRINIYNPNLCNILSNLVKKYNIDPKLLELEITESAYTNDPKLLSDVINELHNRGFIILMDDFGSGYSSLNMLKDITVDVIKFDLKFLYGNNQTGRGGSILSSLIRMAKWLDLKIIAEGVETEEQADFLLSVGCYNSQGYYFYRPMSIEKFEAIDKSESHKLKETNKAEIFNYNKLLSSDSDITFIFDNFIGGIAIYELIGDKIEIIRFNKEYQNILGLTLIKFYEKSKNLIDLIHEDDKEKVYNWLKDIKKTGETKDCRFKRLNVDEEYINIQARAKLINNDNGKSVFYVCINKCHL